MKKSTGIILSVIIGLAIGLASAYFYQNKNIGSYYQETFDSLITVSTSTASYSAAAPVKLLDRDYGRKYVAVSNAGATVIYLMATTTPNYLNLTGSALEPISNVTSTLTTQSLATSTMDNLNGIPIAAGATYEIKRDNLVTGELWATSTAGSIKINISYGK